MGTLVEFVRDYFKNTSKTFIFGCLKNKDYKTMIKMLFEIKNQDDKFYFFEFEYKNALKFNDLEDDLKKKMSKISSLDEIKNIINIDKNLKIVCGSIYMLGEIFK